MIYFTEPLTQWQLGLAVIVTNTWMWCEWEKRCEELFWSSMWGCEDHWELILRQKTLISPMSGQVFLKSTVFVTDSKGTLVLFSWASPVQAFAKRKSPLRTAILFPNCMSFSGPSETVQSFRLTIPRCTRNAVWISSVISAKFLWLWDRKR